MASMLEILAVVLFLFCMAAAEFTANWWWLLGWLVSGGLLVIAVRLSHNAPPTSQPRLGGYMGEEE